MCDEDVQKDIAQSSCTACGSTFVSRNALFRHLRTSGCGGNDVSSTSRHLVIYGYVGTLFHGSQHNAISEESRCPTVEGALLAAIQSMIVQQLGAASARIEVHSRSSRTDRGVHALSNMLHLKISTESTMGSDVLAASNEREWIEKLQRHLPASVFVLRWLPVPNADCDVRRACQKRTYNYHIPYRLLFSEDERHEEHVFSGGEDVDKLVFVTNLPREYDQATFEADLETRIATIKCDCQQPFKIERVRFRYPYRDSAIVQVPNKHDVLKLCEVLDGAVDLPGSKAKLVALPERIARKWRGVHARLRAVMQKISGTHSFHNFSPDFVGADDARSLRSVYSCNSHIQCGYHDYTNGHDTLVLTISGRSFLYKQILSIIGLVVAVVNGSLPEGYIQLALSSAAGIEVPHAPACNLVLIDGSFPIEILAHAMEGYRSGQQGHLGIRSAHAPLEALLREEICSKASMAALDSFHSELTSVVAPRLCKVYLEKSSVENKTRAYNKQKKTFTNEAVVRQ